MQLMMLFSTRISKHPAVFCAWKGITIFNVVVLVVVYLSMYIHTIIVDKRCNKQCTH